MERPSPSPVVRLGTRGGALALWQAGDVERRLVMAHPDITIETRVIHTTGDRVQTIPVAQIGGDGLFTRDIEAALLAGEIDIAVHSLKDLPTTLPEGLALAAVLERADPRDVLVARSGSRLGALPAGSRIGTSSPRRRAQVLAYRPQLAMCHVRGNVPTRLARLDQGEYDALVLARAGLHRLGLDDRVSEVIEAEIVVPAPGQGALAVEARVDDGRVIDLLRVLEHPATRLATHAERACLARLGGGCQAPVGVLATWVDGELALTGVVAAVRGDRVLRASSRAVIVTQADAADAGASLAERLLDHGAAEILAEARSSSGHDGATGPASP